MNFLLITAILAALLAGIALIRSRGESLEAWGLLVLAAGLLWRNF